MIPVDRNMMWLFTPFLFVLTSAQLNLYKTDQTDPLEFDCLYYYVQEEQFIGPRFQFPIYQRIDYCRRPIDRIVESFDNMSIHVQNFTFDELYHLKITVSQLLAWSAPVDLAGQYSLYISQPIINTSFSLEYVFFNCTKPWFGSRCQYSFDLGLDISLADVIEITFQEKSSYSGSPRSITNLTCYQLLTCDRGAPMCLDWREVCNGRIDCMNGGVDEEHCSIMEMNECAEDEYRCHNGMCIPRKFIGDDENNPDCLDRSDELSHVNTFDSCFRDPTFRCEEHTCRPNFGLFPCGDGQCEVIFNSCKNHRNRLLEDATLAKGNLSEKCWMVMACLTLINATIEGHSCHYLFNTSLMISSYLSNCDLLFEFPIHSIALGHVRFFYRNNHSELVNKQVFQPDFICYDAQLCDTIQPTFHYGNLSCQWRTQINRISTTVYGTFIKNVANYFRGCLSSYFSPSDMQASLYCCRNSSKCISKHRLLDFAKDCPMSDDEQYKSSCSLNHPDRFHCNKQEDKCYSPILDRQVCKQEQKQNYSEILFHEFCNGIDNLLRQEINGRNHTDETDCEEWPCSNIYTRCDDYRSCANGEDEWNCIKSDCPIGFRPCLSPINYELTCLSQDHVNDGHIDCLGASDEFQLCQVRDSDSRSHYRFRCWNNTKCTAAFNLCDNQKECPFHDDEKFCGTQRNICPKNHSKINETICQLFEKEIEKRIYFSLENVKTFPSKIVITPKPPIENERKLRPNDSAWMWCCNRGLYARIWNKGAHERRYKCFCPPSFYGDSCEYQSQRISLTLGVVAADQYKSYSIVVRLIDDTSQMSAYEQFPYMAFWGCYRSFNIYLLYSTRPKDMLKNYSMHIDAFDKSSLMYLASWYLQVPFPFLPVNRIVSELMIPARPTSIVHKCSLICKNNGQCMKYLNTERFFCQCPANWSGYQCEQPSRCNDCSPDSICLDSICVCPLNRVGPRCLLPASCLPDSCMNNGQCVLTDDSVIKNNYICICSDQFYGLRCEFTKRRIDISLEKVETTSYMLVHTITVSNESQPISKVVFKKLVRDQRFLKFYVSEPSHLVFIQSKHHYYLVNESLSSITSMAELSKCAALDELISSTLPRIQLIKNYHILCRNQLDLPCFFDDYYMCLCTSERHANCFEFNHQVDLTCRQSDYCQNDATCYQDDHICPSATVCICTDCYFGRQCQFFVKGFGITLDDILRYEIQHNLPFYRQRISVKMSTIATILMFGLGLVSSILSYLTFRRETAQKVGCGLYLFASSITSLLTVIMFTVKFCFLICSQLNLITNRTVLRSGCIGIEPLLKVLFYMDNWLKACVAIERSITIFKGVYFDKVRSKRIAKWIIVALPILIIATTIHEPIHRDIFGDEEEHRHWCAALYSSFLQNYNSTIIIVHFVTPFLINLLSAFFIISRIARLRTTSRYQRSYHEHLREQFYEHKHMLISPILLILLSSPRLIISLMSSCIKSSHDTWLYLVAYFISFTPSVLSFVVFVLPSDFYNKEFRKYFRHR